jgi:DNA-directed RNA polymerase subunit K/omega
MKELDETQPAGPTAEPEDRVIRSKYEFVMAAAKEAERLNDHYRKVGAPPEKVTIEAAKRIRKGLSRIVYEEPQAVSDETNKESTYFFGS